MHFTNATLLFFPKCLVLLCEDLLIFYVFMNNRAWFIDLAAAVWPKH